MNKYKYRIKTEQEFIDEFGRGWRDRVIGSFPNDMDYLLGEIIDPKYYSDFLINGRINSEFIFGIYVPRNGISGTWSISKNMIKEINIIEYNKKRKLVYE